MLIGTPEEFNKYLSYVRNLGFEDTPDYDFLRDLFTQGLKNTGEVEDGEYDWMKLNGGRGWEALKAHPSAHLHNVNPPADASARAMAGASAVRGQDGQRPSRDRAAISADRLNAAQPPPPGSPAKPGVAAMGKNARDRTSGAAGGNVPKRSSGLAGQVDMNTPPASTQAQFQNSNANLVGLQPRTSPAAGALQNNQGRPSQQQEQQPTFVQKMMKVLCCGMFTVKG
jgi:casein kinase 1